MVQVDIARRGYARVQLRRIPRRLCYTRTMRRRKTGYAMEESTRGSVSVDALQKLEYCYTNTDWKTGYAVEESVRGSAAPQKQEVRWSWCSLTVSVY